MFEQCTNLMPVCSQLSCEVVSIQPGTRMYVPGTSRYQASFSVVGARAAVVAIEDGAGEEQHMYNIVRAGTSRLIS